MGEGTERNLDGTPVKDQGSIDPRAGTGTGTGTPRRTAGNSPAPAPGTGKPAPARADRGTGTGKAPEKEKASGLASVKAPEAVPAPEAPKKAQKRSRKAKKPDPTAYNAEQIAALIQGMSNIVAARPDMAVFALQQTEAQQLAQPIANMIAKSERLQNMGEYADAIALVTASLVIFGPRVMIYQEQQKQKKKEKGVMIVDKRKEPKNDGSAGKPIKPDAPKPPVNDSGIFAAIPSTM